MIKRLLFVLFAFFYATHIDAQQYNYQIKITNYDYDMNARSGLCGDAKHVKLWIVYEDNSETQLYYTGNPYDIRNNEFINRFLIKKPKTIHFTSFVHEQDWVGACNGYTASVNKSENITYNSNNEAYGNISAYDSNGGGDATIDVEFNYQITPVTKNFNYKVQYDIDLSNKLTTPPTTMYTGNYNLRLRTNNEGKNIYRGNAFSYDGQAETITNKKYDSIVRFMNRIDRIDATSDITYRTNSQLRCYDDGGPPDSGGTDPDVERDFHDIYLTEQISVSENDCFSYTNIFPSCNTVDIKQMSIYRIQPLENVSKNKSDTQEFMLKKIKVCEPLRVFLNDCNIKSSYAVDYALEDGNFEEYLPYAYRESYFDFDTSSIENINYRNPIKFQIRYYNVPRNQIESKPYLFSPIYSFPFEYCSPDLEEAPNPIKTSCEYKNDGAFKLKFKRDLYEGETLVISLYDPTTTIIGQKFTSTLTDEGNGLYSYSWPLEIPKGNYLIKYQTHNKPELIDSDDISWASLTATNVEIGFAAPLKFEVRKLNDENCFKAGDGKIEIFNVEGEQNRKFLYKIDQVNGANLENIRDWTEFTGNSVVVEKLGSIGVGKYRIQVKDEKDCFFRDP